MTAGDFKQSANLNGGILASGYVNPLYNIAFSGVPTAGTFTVTLTSGVNGSAPASQSATITYSTTLTAAAVQAALQALTGFSGVTVTGSNGGSYTIAFPQGLGICSVTVTTALTGGTLPAALVTGVGVETTVYTVPASSVAKIATFPITSASATSGVLSASTVPSGGTTTDGTHHRVSNYPLAANDSTKINEVEGGFYAAGSMITINCTVPVTYELTGAVSS